MNDIVTRLRNWRNVHLARLHLLMDEAADEMERLSKTGHCPVPDNAAEQDNDRRLAALQALAELDEELGPPRRTPDTHATPRVGSEQSGCTLTKAEREAVEDAVSRYVPGITPKAKARAATLRGLLERLGGAK